MARRSRVRLAALATTMLVAVALPACSGGGGGTAGPAATLGKYLDAWGAQNDARMVHLTANPPADLATTLAGIRTELRMTSESHRAGRVTEANDGKTATAPVRNSFTSDPWGGWKSRGTVTLVKRGDRWKVRWDRAQFAGQAGADTRFALDEAWPDRAPVLGAGGIDLTPLAPMVRVGIQGSRVTDVAALTAALQLAGATPEQVNAAVDTSKQHPDWFVPVVEITAAHYAEIRDVIYPVPGTLFRQFTARTTLTPGLDAHLVGSTGSITAELLEELGSPYGPNATVGRRGIEQQYERRLAGTPGETIRIVGGDGVTAVATLAEFPPKPGTAVQTTIDPTVQRAIETALSGVPGEAAMVAIRASTGEVLGSASVPSSNGYDTALRGRYPPGSTFKVITTAALLQKGVTPDSVLSCPATVTVNGRTFHNYEGEAEPALSLTDAFALSCNNAFIGAVDGMPFDVLPTVAQQFGLGVEPELGVAAFGGSVPTPVSADQQAATSIGQASVTASPLAMATVAASVASGTWHAPRLVAGAPDDSVAAKPLDPGVIAALQNTTEQVVLRGTAAGAGLPPGTHGKTGTAEFGTADPPQTHAWFIGYRDDIAFAVVVPGGGVGGEVAAPLAATFLNALG